MTVLRPEDFGTIGQSAAQDTAAWAALFAAAQSYDIIEARGEYLIVGSSLLLSGKDGVRFDLSGARFRQQANFSKTFQATNCNDLTISGGAFFGRGGAAGEYNGASSGFNEVSALFLDTCTGIEIESAKFVGHAGGDINLRNCTRDKIHHCHFEGIGADYINPIDNGSDFAICAQEWNDRPMGCNAIHEWTDNTISGHAFGVQAVATKSFILRGNDVSCEGQHGVYGIELDGMNIAGNVFRGCPQQGVKMQHENYSQHYFGNPSLTRRGGVIANNTIYDCGDGIGIISSSESDGKEQYINGMLVTGNTILNCTQDGIIMDRCVNAVVSSNVIIGAGRYGSLWRDSSGRFDGNLIRWSHDSAVTGKLADNLTVANNTLINCGLSGVGDGAIPVRFWNTDATAIPSQSANPVVKMNDNQIRFTSGDTPATYVIKTESRYRAEFTENSSTSAKPAKVFGAVVKNRNNDFTVV